MLQTATKSDPLPFLRGAVRRNPEHPRYRAVLGEALLVRRRRDEAIWHLGAALTPGSPPRVPYLLSLAYLSVGRYREAAVTATLAIEASDGFLERARYVRARAHRALGDLKASFNDLAFIVEGQPALSETAHAFARMAIEYAAKAGRSAAQGYVEIARLALAAKRADNVFRDENEYLAARLALIASDPVDAENLLRRTSFPSSEEASLWRGLALLRLGRGVAATAELNRARTDPQTAAVASRWMSRIGDGVAMDAAAIDLVDSKNGLLWPDPLRPDLGLLPDAAAAPTVPGVHLFENDPKESVRFDAWVTSHGDTNRAEEVRPLDDGLARGRSYLANGAPVAAVAPLEEAFDAAQRLSRPLSPELRMRQQAIAEALVVAYANSGDDAAAGARAESLYSAGARYGRFLEMLAQRLVLREARRDPFALEVAVSALEAGIESRSYRKALLEALAVGLRIGFEDALGPDEPRLLLLERLHRFDSELAFPRVYLARLHFRRGDLTHAEAFIERLQGPLARSAEVLVLRAAGAESRGENDRALELYHEALEAHPGFPGIHFRIGRLLLQRERRRMESGPSQSLGETSLAG